MEENARCCICGKELEGVQKTENYCCDECYEKYLATNKGV